MDEFAELKRLRHENERLKKSIEDLRKTTITPRDHLLAAIVTGLVSHHGCGLGPDELAMEAKRILRAVETTGRLSDI